MKNNIGTRIKTMRLSRNMTQSDLARELRVSRSAVGMWESGEREPNFDTIEALADIFNVPVSALVDKKRPADNGGLAEEKQQLIEFVKSLPDSDVRELLQIARIISARSQ